MNRPPNVRPVDSDGPLVPPKPRPIDLGLELAFARRRRELEALFAS